MPKNPAFQPRKHTHYGKDKWRFYLGRDANGSPRYSRRFDSFEECEKVAQRERAKAAELQATDGAKSALTHEELVVQGQLARLDQIGVSLQACVDYYFGTNFPKKGQVSAAVAVEDFLESKRNVNKGDNTMENYERLLRPFAEHFNDQQVHSISTDDLNDYFGGLDTWNNNTKHQAMRFMKTVFNWWENLNLVEVT